MSKEAKYRPMPTLYHLPLDAGCRKIRILLAEKKIEVDLKVEKVWELRQRVYGVLLDTGNPIAGWFHRAEIERMLTEHMDGKRDHRKRLWSLYCLFRFAATARA